MTIAIRKLVTPHGGNQTCIIDIMPSLEFAKVILSRHVASLDGDPMVFDLTATELGFSCQTPLNRIAWSIIPVNADLLS